MVEKKCIVASCSKVAAHALNSHAPMAYCQDHYKEYTGAKKRPLHQPPPPPAVRKSASMRMQPAPPPPLKGNRTSSSAAPVPPKKLIVPPPIPPRDCNNYPVLLRATPTETEVEKGTGWSGQLSGAVASGFHDILVKSDEGKNRLKHVGMTVFNNVRRKVERGQFMTTVMSKDRTNLNTQAIQKRKITASKVFSWSMKREAHVNPFVGDEGEEKLEFNVIKLCRGLKKTRKWEVNLKERTVSNLLSKKAGVKRFPAYFLSKLELEWNQAGPMLRLHFKNPALHPYDLIFDDIAHRHAFYTAALLAMEDIPLADLRLKPPVPRHENFSLYIATWNCGNAPPPSDLSPWIPRDAADIYAIGAQECYYDPPTQKTCESDWFERLDNHLGVRYVRLKCNSLWEIRLVLYVRADRINKITSLKTSMHATGIAGVMGNKGGVGMAFRYNETSVLIINTHLAAHQHKLQQRNEDAKEILSNLDLSLTVPGTSTMLDNKIAFDHIFFFGDMNYRVDNHTFEEAVDLVTKRDYAPLIANDQLLQQLRGGGGGVFDGFEDGTITFPPTFKVVRPRTSLQYNPQRIPSYCDRILSYTSEGKDKPNRVAYSSHEDMTTSDHIPVSALFEIRSVLPYQHMLLEGEGVGGMEGPLCIQFKSAHVTNLIDVAPPADGGDVSTEGILLTFFSPVVSGLHHSKWATNFSRDSCAWVEDDLPPMCPFVSAPSYAREHFVVVLVEHAIQSTGVAVCALLGQGRIPLAPLFDQLQSLGGLSGAASTPTSSLTIPLYQSGVRAGTLSVDMSVMLRRPAESHFRTSNLEEPSPTPAPSPPGADDDDGDEGDEDDAVLALTIETTIKAAAEDARRANITEEEAAEKAFRSRRRSSVVAGVTPPLPFRAETLYDYVAMEASELMLSRGELVTVSAEQAGWWYGTLDGSGRVGWFPATYVRCLRPTGPTPQNLERQKRRLSTGQPRGI